MPRVEQELLTLPEHLNSPPVFCGVRVTLFLVLHVVHIVVCSVVSICSGQVFVGRSTTMFDYSLGIFYILFLNLTYG